MKPPDFDPVRWSGEFYQKHPIWFLLTMALLCVTGIVTWPLIIGFTLIWIGRGVWHLVEQKEKE